MKKVLLILTAVALFTSAELFAQVDTAEITASATVTSSASAASGVDLEFGDVQRGVTATIAIDESGNADASGASAPQLGTFTINGSVGESFAVSFASTAFDLTGVGDVENTLPFTMAGANFGRVTGSDGSNGNFNPSLGVEVTINDDDGPQPVTITVGGQVTPGSNQALDTYNGTITLQIDFVI